MGRLQPWRCWRDLLGEFKVKAVSEPPAFLYAMHAASRVLLELLGDIYIKIYIHTHIYVIISSEPDFVCYGEKQTLREV